MLSLDTSVDEVKRMARTPSEFRTREEYAAWKQQHGKSSDETEAERRPATLKQLPSTPRTRGRSAVLALVALCGLFGAWLYLSPYLALRGLKHAITSGDSLALEDRVDFQSLRQSLKDQINAAMLKSAATQLRDNPFGALAMGLVSKFAEGTIDALVTPTGLAGLSRGEEPTPGRAASGGPSNADEDDLFKNARVTHDSLRRFSAWVRNDKGNEIRFVFVRHGLSWMLTNVLLPADLGRTTDSSPETDPQQGPIN